MQNDKRKQHKRYQQNQPKYQIPNLIQQIASPKKK